MPISMRTAPFSPSIRVVPALPLPAASMRACAKKASKQPLV
ncbi:hypothetical protein AB8806_23270 [Ralstonia syzygii subsp. celebesensis]